MTRIQNKFELEEECSLIVDVFTDSRVVLSTNLDDVEILIGE